MVKKNTKKNNVVCETVEEKRERELLQIRKRDYLIPEPTYIHEVGDSVEMGNLQDIIIVASFDNNKIYEIDYTQIHANYGREIIEEHQRKFVTWLQVRKITDNVESFLLNDEDIRLSYFQMQLSSLLAKVYSFGVNFDPEYQRDYVWTLEDKISLIDSIFHRVDIGKFSFVCNEDKKWSETGFADEILDGKQRIRAILDFYEDRFKYKGKCFSELSWRDKEHFTGYSISFGEAENLNEEQILRYFITLNTNGRAMSKEHIDKVRKVLERKQSLSK